MILPLVLDLYKNVSDQGEEWPTIHRELESQLGFPNEENLSELNHDDAYKKLEMHSWASSHDEQALATLAAPVKKKL